MRPPKVLYSVTLNGMVLIPSASAVLAFCPNSVPTEQVGGKKYSAVFDGLGTDCQVPGALRSACMVLSSFQTLCNSNFVEADSAFSYP